MLTSVCANILIDGASLPGASAYERFVDTQVQRIFSRRTGYWVLWRISHLGTRSGRTLVIAPFGAAQQKASTQEGFPYPDTHFTDRRAAAPKTGLLFKSHLKGPGKGSDSVIHYNPERCEALAAQAHSKRIAFVGMAADEALLHEMLHALRGMQGRDSDVKTTGGYEILSYETVEDFFAILITNIYMAEKGASQLRRNHRGFDPLPDSLNTSPKFLSSADNIRWIKYLWLQEPELFGNVARVVTPTGFNPLREYAANRSRYDRR